jgi:single-strand DNA-binding protein
MRMDSPSAVGTCLSLAHNVRDEFRMNINRITIAGFTGKDARPSATQGGRSVTRLSVATARRYKDSQQQWQEKTQWHTCVAYGSTADYAARIQTGDHVFLEGELVYREYERTVETESGPVKVQWPVTEIIIDSISLIDRKQKQEKREAA